MTVNTHKGFTALQPQVHPARAARGGAHGRRRRGVPAGSAGHASRHRAQGRQLARGAALRIPGRHMWPQFAYGRNAVYPKGHHGNAVLSKFPIVHYKNHDVSISGPEKRGLLHCVLRLPGPADRGARDLRAPGPGRERIGCSSSSCCARSCASEVPADAPLIVAGDFNDWRGRAHDDPRARGAALQRGVRPGQRQRRPGPFPSRFPLLPLDRIYVRNAGVHAPVVLPRRPWSHLSDHAPLAAEIAAVSRATLGRRQPRRDCWRTARSSSRACSRPSASAQRK